MKEAPFALNGFHVSRETWRGFDVALAGYIPAIQGPFAISKHVSRETSASDEDYFYAVRHPIRALWITASASELFHVKHHNGIASFVLLTDMLISSVMAGSKVGDRL